MLERFVESNEALAGSVAGLDDDGWSMPGEAPPGVFSEEGQGGAAIINADGGLSWQTPSSRPDDLYVHVVDQPTLNQRIDELLVAG